MSRVLHILVGQALLLCGCGLPDYDRVRYDGMERTILQSTNLLAGMQLSDAAKLLSLDGVRWDEGYSNVPLGQERIYHFRGFCLRLELEVRPQGIAPGSTQSFSYTEPQLRSNGVWWVSQFWPHLEIDRLNDPKIRMSNYWDNAHSGFRWRGVQMKSIETKMQAEKTK